MNRADGQKTTLVVRGETIEAALEQARSQLGVMDIKVLNATRMRRGGVAGFFAKDLGVELEVAPEDDARPLELALAHATAATAAQPQRSHNSASFSDEPEYLRDAASEIASATDGDRGVADLTRPSWAQVPARSEESTDEKVWERSLLGSGTENPVVDATALAVRDFTEEDAAASEVLRTSTSAAADGFAAVLKDQLTRTASEFGGEENLDVSVFSSSESNPEDTQVAATDEPVFQDQEFIPFDLAHEAPEYLEHSSHNIAHDIALEVESETIESSFDTTLVYDLDEFEAKLADPVTQPAPTAPVSAPPAARDERIVSGNASDSTLVTYSIDDAPRPSAPVATPAPANPAPVAPTTPPVTKLYIKPLQTPNTAPTDPSVIKPAESSVIKSVPESAREEFERRVKAIAAEYMFEDLGDELNVQRVIDNALPLQPPTSIAQPQTPPPFAAAPKALSDDAVMPLSAHPQPGLPAEPQSQPQLSRPTRPQAPQAQAPQSQAPQPQAPQPQSAQPAHTPNVPPVMPSSAPFAAVPSIPYEAEPQLPFDMEPVSQPTPFSVPSVPQEEAVVAAAPAPVPAPAPTPAPGVVALAPAFDEEAEVAAQLAASRAISSAIAEQLFSGLKPAPAESDAAVMDGASQLTPGLGAQIFGTAPAQPAVFSPVELAPLGGLEDLSDAVVSYVRPRPGQPGMVGIDASPTTGLAADEDGDAEKPRFELDVQAWMASRNLRRVVADTEIATKTPPAQSQEREKAEAREIPAWRIETWQASREARNVQPAAQTRVAPAPQVISRLISMGVPHSVIAGLHDGMTLRDALSAVKTFDPSSADVTLVIGRADLARKWAGGIARINGIPDHEVVVVTSTPVAGELSTVEHIQEWRMQHLNATSVVAISLHAPSTNMRMVSRMVEATRADVVRLVVDANDTRAIEMWSQIAPNAVLDIVGMARAERPGALLALGLPIATVDGAPATPESLALALLEHSSR